MYVQCILNSFCNSYFLCFYVFCFFPEGIYVIMFENILITFGKTLLLTSLLVLAFAFAFFMAFYNPEPSSIVSDYKLYISTSNFTNTLITRNAMVY